MSSEIEMSLKEFMKKSEDFILAGILFLATLFFANEYYYLLFPIGLVVFKYSRLKEAFLVSISNKRNQFIFISIAIFIGLCYLNKIINGHEIRSLKDYYSSFLLFPILLFSAWAVDLKQISKYFLYFICIEIIFGFFEFNSGVRSFFVENLAPINNNSDFLYDHRTNGLSISSSIFSVKILIGLISIEFLKIRKDIGVLIRSVLIIGVILTFNRALIVAILIFWSILFIRNVFWLKARTFSKVLLGSQNFLIFGIFFSIFASHSLWTEMNKQHQEKNKLKIKFKTESTLSFSDFKEDNSTIHYPKIKEQHELDTSFFLNKYLSKSTEGINTSGRTLIWINFIQYWNENKWFGFGSDKLMFKTVDQDKKKIKLIHAHNSYLEILASHGIILTLLFFSLLFVIWNKKNIVFILPICVYSLFQYGIFWGFSILDFFFISLLITNTKLLDEA